MSNIIKFVPKSRPNTKTTPNTDPNRVYFILEENDFTYVRFGKVSVIQGKDSFAKRLTLVKS